MIEIKECINNLNINYIERGEGRAVLILPGWGTTINTYMTLINYISTYAKVYCMDMPGFGESQQPNDVWDIDKYIDLVIEFIKKRNITDLDLIGHSNGGRIIIKMVTTRKLNFKIGKIILIGSAGIVHKKSVSKKIRIKIFKTCKKILNITIIKKIWPNALEKLQTLFGSEDYKKASPILRQTLVKIINEDLKENLPKITQPTLLLWGEEDTATPIEDGMLMEKMIPDAGLVKFSNCSHFVFLERAMQINAIIANFLKGGQ